MTQALGILEFLLCIENSRIPYYVIPQLDWGISIWNSRYKNSYYYFKKLLMLAFI
ncbi:MAG: hypothetical protein MR927_02165 [Campylobacter sp.]|nr:hypothetical protein [Campylobacter sp.]